MLTIQWIYYIVLKQEWRDRAEALSYSILYSQCLSSEINVINCSNNGVSVNNGLWLG